MFNFLSNIADLFRGKERADWVVQTWLNDHADEYRSFVTGIEKMAEGDMTTAFEMYRVMKDCMPPEAEQYYDILMRTLSGEAKALHEMTKLEHAIEIGECAVNERTLEINIGTGEVNLTEAPRKGMLVVNSSDLIDRWEKLPLYSKAYCKEQYEKIRSSMPVDMRKGFGDAVANMVKIHYVANLVFMPGMMANLYDKAVNENNGMLFAMYYFVTYDHGLQRMAEVFSKVITNETPDIDGVTVFKSTIYRLAHTSISNGWDSKEEWKETADKSVDDEAWKEIMLAVRNAKAKHGKPKKQTSLDDILTTKDKTTLKTLMRQFLEEHDGQYGLAYLRWCLDKAGSIKDVSYMEYHRAMESFLGKQIISKKPQERYSLLKKDNKIKEHKRIWREVDLIECKWVKRFRDSQ